MSRVGKKPIPIPERTKVTLKGNTVTVQGSKGTLSREIHSGMKLEISDSEIAVKIPSYDREQTVYFNRGL